jgi:hypothetical protein
LETQFLHFQKEIAIETIPPVHLLLTGGMVPDICVKTLFNRENKIEDTPRILAADGRGRMRQHAEQFRSGG